VVCRGEELIIWPVFEVGLLPILLLSSFFDRGSFPAEVQVASGETMDMDVDKTEGVLLR